MSIAAKTANPSRRIILSSVVVQQGVFAALAGVMLALAFPKTGAAWLAPLGIAALFWSWRGTSWKRSFALGWFAGLVFYTMNFWWWSTTIKEDVGGLAYVAVVLGAGLEATAIGVAGSFVALLQRRTAPALVPLGMACAFTVFEWIRSIGVIGAPFGQLGYTQAETPLRIFASYIGTIGITFVLCVLGAYAADGIARRTVRAFLVAIATVAAAWIVAWVAWPARHLPLPVIPVAAVQGNIAQSLKWQPQALPEAIARYTSLTRAASAAHPRLIVWPETVITLQNHGLNQDPALITTFTQLARATDATLVVGSIEVRDTHAYNALFFFDPTGLQNIYEKRQLVPFAEHVPGRAFFSWVPYLDDLAGRFEEGRNDGVYPTRAGLLVAPLICWESAFSDLAGNQLRNGARALIVSTDDAWFGTSSGPYQHAQIAQLRAIESGEYVIRAAATGISGIIAPDGRWLNRTALETQTVVNGAIGPPVGSVFAHIGPNAIASIFALFYLLLFFVPSRRSDAA